MPRYVLIANPGTPRCQTYHREFREYWADRGQAPELEVVRWADVVPRLGDLDGLPAFDSPAVVRLESPGKDRHVSRLLLEAGALDDPDEPPQDWRTLEISEGQLLRPGLFHRGFRRVLCGLRQSFDARPHLTSTACPLAIAEMFDKAATSRKLTTVGVPVPEWMPPDECHARTIDFHDAIREAGWPVVYTKLNTGSSATGIVVGHHPPGEEPWGFTTLTTVNGHFYRTRRVRQVRKVEMVRCLDFVLREGAIVQRGIPMAQIDGQNFDVRVVCVYGKPVASIFRLSSQPITNLHLGGRRGDFARCRAAIPTRTWLDALDHCADAAGCFDSAVAGVDLLFERGFRRHYILEVNAFGDFFPGWADANGRSLYALELDGAAWRVA